MQLVLVERTRVSQVTPDSPGTPRAVVYAYNVISPVNGSFATVALRVLTLRLDTSTAMSGPHAFAVRFSADRLSALPRPPHPRPALMTLRNAPRSGTGWQII